MGLWVRSGVLHATKNFNFLYLKTCEKHCCILLITNDLFYNSAVALSNLSSVPKCTVSRTGHNLAATRFSHGDSKCSGCEHDASDPYASHEDITLVYAFLMWRGAVSRGVLLNRTVQTTILVYWCTSDCTGVTQHSGDIRH